LAPSRLA